MVSYANGYGVKLTMEESKRYSNEWLEEFPEWLDFFNFVRKHVDVTSGLGTITQLYVGRVRGGATFPALCNSFFQGLGADGAKNALYEGSKRCYVPEYKSVLYGARPVGFVHDEILTEVFEEIAHEQAVELSRVMVDACNVYLPDVPVKCPPKLCKRWGKDVETVYDRSGRLQPYDLARDRKQEVYYDAGANERVEWKETV